MRHGVTGRSCGASRSTTESKAWPPSISTAMTPSTLTPKRSRSRWIRRKTRCSTSANSSRLSRGRRTLRLTRAPTQSDRWRLSFGASRRTTPFAMATNVQRSSYSVRSSTLNGFDMTLSEDEIFELAVGIADTHLSVDDVEAKLRPAVIPL